MVAPKGKGRTALSNMVIKEISLVDDGANPGAHVSIIKARTDEPSELEVLQLAEQMLEPVNVLISSTALLMKGKTPEQAHEALGALAEEIDGLGSTIASNAMAEGHSAALSAAHTAVAKLKEILMDIAQLQEALEKANQKNAELQASLETVTKAKDTAEAKVIELEGAIAKAKQTPEEAEQEYLKSMPAALRERFEKMAATQKATEEELAKAKDKEATTEAIAKARADGLPDPDKTGPLLKRIGEGKTTAEDAATITSVLKAAGNQTAMAALFKQAGQGGQGGDGQDAGAQLQAKADEIFKAANGSLTKEQAYDKALDQNPALYTEYQKQKRAQ